MKRRTTLHTHIYVSLEIRTRSPLPSITFFHFDLELRLLLLLCNCYFVKVMEEKILLLFFSEIKWGSVIKSVMMTSFHESSFITHQLPLLKRHEIVFSLTLGTCASRDLELETSVTFVGLSRSMIFFYCIFFIFSLSVKLSDIALLSWIKKLEIWFLYGKLL